MNNSLSSYQTNRETLLARIIQTLSDDERVAAAWLSGSYARGNADALSDLDLTLVISDSHSENLCKRIEQVSSQTTFERLDLFSQFGTPAIIHENNNNAPEGGTFTYVLYAQSAIMVDWILIPQEKANRPPGAHLLFEKTSIPVRLTEDAESQERRLKQASEIVAFFWMMMAVTVKYIIRQDRIFVIHWLEELSGMLREVERLLAGKTWKYQRGSLSVFEPTREGQQRALLQLGKRMEYLIPKLSSMGGHVLPSPMPEIIILLNLEEED
jgi:predicted nucleotidyltransferase